MWNSPEGFSCVLRRKRQPRGFSASSIRHSRFSSAMRHLIYLGERRAGRSKSPQQARPAFFFDVTSPLSYLMAERVERKLGEVDWGAAARSPRARAESCARALRLPLVWPEGFPGVSPCAQRACAFACEIGAGA